MAEQFHETELGRKFFEEDIPSIVDSLKRIAARLEIVALTQPVDKAHQRTQIKTTKTATAEDGSPECPRCGSGMRTRARRMDGSLFWGCTRYPECHGIVSYSDEDHQRKTGLDGPQKDASPDDDDIPF